jgi:hypothetical protein
VTTICNAIETASKLKGFNATKYPGLPEMITLLKCRQITPDHTTRTLVTKYMDGYLCKNIISENKTI